MKVYPSINNGLSPSIAQRIEGLRNKESIAGGEETLRLLRIDLEYLLESKKAIERLIRHQSEVTYDIRSNDYGQQNYDSLTGNYGDLLGMIELAIETVQENVCNLMGYYKPISS